MKIKKFRIWNYKSIIDSQDCYPSQGVTILAGKNESGKTSILEALEDFNSDRDIREKAIPIQNEDNKPKMRVWFSCSKEDLQEIFQTIDYSHEIKDDFTEINLEKNFPNTYSLGEETIKKLGLSNSESVDIEVVKTEAKEPLDTIAAIYNAHQGDLQTVPPPQFDPNDFLKTKEIFEKFKADTEPLIPNIPEPDSSALPKHIDKIIEICQKAIDGISTTNKFIEEFKNYYPNFILFSSFNDIFPNTIPVGELDNNEWIKDLSVISNLDVSVVKSTNDRRKIDHKTKLNIDINNEFKRFWVQDLSELLIEWDNEKLSFWIQEDGHHFEPEIRSQGKRWYLAFYVKVTARAKEEYTNIILIDEPGLYLHATAQRDVLKKLEEVSKDAQVIFSTHSPYLIEADKLDRLRLIYRTSADGTIIENKIHKVADKETLTPILTAIGLEMTNSISQIDRINNVVVEGPSDYYYLQAFKRLSKEENTNFIYGGGSGNMPKVGTILQGWGCKVIYLYDTDQGLKDALKNIKAEWVTTTQEMITKIPVQGAIEDIFSQDNYKKYVLKNDKLSVKGKNSEYAKLVKRDKVLDAKLFLESVESGTIKMDKTTESNIKKLIETINDKFKNYISLSNE